LGYAFKVQSATIGAQKHLYGKPLALLADWMPQAGDSTKLHNAGFAEGAADALFSSLVQLDQQKGGSVAGYDTSSGNLIRKQGGVFNSPLHFVGFGQGAVVNTEIVQRLGTFFPLAGGTDAQHRDLHVTTIDPHDYNPSSPAGTFRNILDPAIRTWNNVTYADNYYQQNSANTALNGQDILTADWSLDLSQLLGFSDRSSAGTSHQTALSWYAGTASLNESRLPDSNGNLIYRRLGDLPVDQRSGDPNTATWYTPDQKQANFEMGPTQAPWEGIGTGWAHSVLGGGELQRPYGDSIATRTDKAGLGDFKTYLENPNNRDSVTQDNTYDKDPIGTRMRGDYAVPTLFDGNFDAIAVKMDA
jgi:hypothetical protein